LNGVISYPDHFLDSPSKSVERGSQGISEEETIEKEKGPSRKSIEASTTFSLSQHD
jgi:hypothetical protein